MSEKKQRALCEQCKQPGVIWDGNCVWDESLQDFVIADTFDDTWCPNCEDDCGVLWEDIE